MQELVKGIIADKEVDAAEAEQLELAIFADGKVDESELKVVCAVKEGVTKSCPEFDALFVTVFKAFCLEDDTTPGVVDDSEAKVIVDLFTEDGEIDDLEKLTVEAIIAEATGTVPSILSDLVA